ncbi:MAG: WxL domain-containing protein [Pseudolactococcus laudensis]|uniref:WxL domain-containing protein n=1 Tax=Pseudolactococcus laudensis TaxID=1494461 RepID=UPI003F94955E
MKKIKLLSALALSIGVVSTLATTASADTKTSNGYASFKEDTSAIEPKIPGEIGGGKVDPNPGKGTVAYTPIGKNELGIVQSPTIFNFGETILKPDSRRNDLTIQALAKNADGSSFADVYGDKSYVQYVTVYDGRTAVDGWELTASATELTDKTATSKKLTGATISVANTKRWNEDVDAGKGPNTNLSGSDFTITTDGTPAKVMGTTTAKYESDVVFRAEDVSFKIPKQSVQLGNFDGTVTWTLVAAPTTP